MAKKLKAGREPEDWSVQEWNAVAFHLRCMALTQTQYLEWCRANGFVASLRKDERQRERERAARERQRSDAALDLLRQRNKNPHLILEQLFADRLDVERAPPEWRRAQELLATLGKRADSRAAFRALLVHALARSKLFSAAPVIADYPRDEHNCFLGALASLATHCHSWLRPVEEWRPRSKNASRQLGSLARHLLAEYDVPPFMDSVWFKRTRTQLWFVHLGRGGSVRTLVRPLVCLNRKMAHHFLAAPADYTLEQALRWGQVIGLGGHRGVAAAIRGTRLCRVFGDDDFWVSVLRFFIANPLLDPASYGPIIDFIQAQKFGEAGGDPAPHPGFSMRRREPGLLMRQVDAWHRQLGREELWQDFAWPASGIQPFELVEGREGSRSFRRWTLRELLTSTALAEEGRAMGHCVASYAPSCSNRQTSIWAMRTQSSDGERRQVTVGVDLHSKVIIEARQRFNQMPGERQLQVLRRWAMAAGLSVPGYLA